jgi:hypothetical protein
MIQLCGFPSCSAAGVSVCHILALTNRPLVSGAVGLRPQLSQDADLDALHTSEGC